MAGSTTITLQPDTKEDLDEFREEGESWNSFFQRWMANDPPVRPGISRILEAVERIPERTAQLTAKKVEERLR